MFYRTGSAKVMTYSKGAPNLLPHLTDSRWSNGTVLVTVPAHHSHPWSRCERLCSSAKLGDSRDRIGYCAVDGRAMHELGERQRCVGLRDLSQPRVTQ
jgi:hypothetical protein